MCERCVELDAKIDRYQQMARMISDQRILDGIAEAIEKATLKKPRFIPNESCKASADYSSGASASKVMGFVEHCCSSVIQDAEAGRIVISVSDPHFGSKHRAFGGLRCERAPALHYLARRVDFDCKNGCHGRPALH
jgi:hypothetical protein